jgi:CubicO group peptidase (beta-lactamase class C family)
MAAAFDQLRRWPARAGRAEGRVAAVVVDRSGPRAAEGPIDAPFPLASVTKLLVAVAMLVALEEGSVALDDPCGPPGSTLRHLLAHASGLAPDERAVLAAPATRRIYSNAGFEVAGEHLEARAGLGPAAYLHEALAEPLRLAATALQGSPAHGATSSALDVGRVATELLSPTLVTEETLRTATTAVFPDLAGVLPGFGRQAPNPWGLGLEVRGHKAPHWTGRGNSARTFGHFGRSGTFCWVDPVAGLGCVALSDLGFGPWAVEAWPAFNDAVLDELG